MSFAVHSDVDPGDQSRDCMREIHDRQAQIFTAYRDSWLKFYTWESQHCNNLLLSTLETASQFSQPVSTSDYVFQPGLIDSQSKIQVESPEVSSTNLHGDHTFTQWLANGNHNWDTPIIVVAEPIILPHFSWAQLNMISRKSLLDCRVEYMFWENITTF